jgi:CheY-like chemotaxis protein
MESGADPSLLPALDMIRRNIELESRLIDDLLDLSRIARGRLRLDLEVVDIHRALRSAVEVCLDETFVAGLDVVTELKAAEHHTTVDYARLMQIAWNLVRNAVKFTPAGGRLTIRTSNAAGAGAGARLIVEFEDTGIGIAPEVLPRIFDAFEQGETDLRRRSQGLGLGLAICRSLAEAMGGRLSASSPGVGLGSTFRLELATVPAPAPAAIKAPPRDPIEARRSPRECDLRILIVEDNPDTLRFLATVLRARGHEVITADTIAAAREALRRAKRPFELLLSDIELPDGNGLELMRDLRGRGGLRGIAMSGFGAEEDLQLSRSVGFLDHLIKPIDPQRLDAAIRRACDATRDGEPGDDEDSWSPTRGGDSGPFRVLSTHES